MVQGDLPYILVFYITTFFISLIGYIPASKFLKNMPDKGYGLWRIMGLLIVSYISWILAYIVKLPSTYFTLFLLILGGIIYLALYKRVYIFHDIVINYKTYLFGELIFILSFIMMIIYRGAVPKIEGIEKFMDFAIINGLVRARTMPPEDVWFSGTTINYYYFGHFCLAVINKLTQIPTAISYNLNVAFLFAAVISSAYSINLAISRNKYLSIFGGFLLAAAGNLDYFYQTVIKSRTDYFYAEARSLIEFTINEFPSYSYLISDLHAHIINIPFVLLFVGLITNLFFNKELAKNKLYLLLIALSVGSFGIINSWDLIIYFPVFALVYFLITFNKNDKTQIINTVKYILIVALTSILFFIPFYLSFRPGANGIGFVTDHIAILDISRMFGYFLINGIFFICGIFLYRNFKDSDKFTAILLAYGILLIMVPNVIFFKDIYFKLNPQYYRANTIFKFWYQAWIVLSLTVPYTINKIINTVSLKNIQRKVFVGAYVLINFFLTFYIFKYTVTSLRYVIGPEYNYYGLDGAKYLSEKNLGDREIIDWLNRNIKGQPVILETDGKSYSMDSLISSYTGLPTPVGWSEHQLGWRNDWEPIAFRMGDIEQMYENQSVEEVKKILQKYQIKYVVISNREKLKHGTDSGSSLRMLSTPVLNVSGTELRKVNEF